MYPIFSCEKALLNITHDEEQSANVLTRLVVIYDYYKGTFIPI